MRIYDGSIDFREVPGKALEGSGRPRGAPGGIREVARESLGGPRGVPRESLGVPGRSQEPGGSRKESSSATRVRFVGSLEGPKGFLGHLRGVSARSLGSPVASLGNPWEVPGPKVGSFSVTEV